MNTIFMEALMTLLSCFALYAWQKYVKPWLVQHRLLEAAQVAVEAAEAIYGRYHGEDKLQKALDQLAELGFDISAAEVVNAVRAAWKRLNTEQIASGEKTVTE